MNVKHAITTTSGTTALHLALISTGIGPDDAVFVPDLTMIAVPYAVLYTGASPIPVDINPETYNINPRKIREFITGHCRYDPINKSLMDNHTHKTLRAILPVHLYGHPCEMDSIKAIADEYSLLIIEDAAEAHGTMVFKEGNKEKGMYAGAIGDVGCFSFYANKIITTGEGGMVVTNSEKIAANARRYKDLAHSPERRFLHTDLAFNYRMKNLQAAVGTAQMEDIDKSHLHQTLYGAGLLFVTSRCSRLDTPYRKRMGPQCLLDVYHPRPRGFWNLQGSSYEPIEREGH